MRKVSFVIAILLLFSNSYAQETLQSVTDRGNITTNSISFSGNNRGLTWGYSGDAADLYYNNDSGNGYGKLYLDIKDDNIQSQAFVIRGKAWDNSIKAVAYFAANGNVGIGTNSPSSVLDIRRDGTGQVDLFRASTSDNHYIGYLNYDTNSSTINLGTAGYGNAHLAFWTNGLERIRILSSNGNVGIGTSSPDSKLTVAGKIHSQEVQVSVNAGADFVFDKDYDLKSLSAIGEYIRLHKHLPGVASAAEMKKNGIDLGEMNIKLLQKIEELTLHLIEKEKQMTSQEERINRLEEAMKSIKQ